MLELRDLLYFPPSLRHRNKSWKKLKSKLLGIEKYDDNYYLIRGETNNHIQIFMMKKIALNEPVKIYCDCKSFLYEFAHILNDYDGLFNQDNFGKALIYTPDDKNPNSVITGCKHIIAFANFLYRKANTINNRELE